MSRGGRRHLDNRNPADGNISESGNPDAGDATPAAGSATMPACSTRSERGRLPGQANVMRSTRVGIREVVEQVGMCGASHPMGRSDSQCDERPPRPEAPQPDPNRRSAAPNSSSRTGVRRAAWARRTRQAPAGRPTRAGDVGRGPAVQAGHVARLGRHPTFIVAAPVRTTASPAPRGAGRRRRDRRTRPPLRGCNDACCSADGAGRARRPLQRVGQAAERLGVSRGERVVDAREGLRHVLEEDLDDLDDTSSSPPSRVRSD